MEINDKLLGIESILFSSLIKMIILVPPIKALLYILLLYYFPNFIHELFNGLRF